MSESAPLRITKDVCNILAMVCGADVRNSLTLDIHELLSNLYLIGKCSDEDLETIAIYACVLLLRLQKVSHHVTMRNIKKIFIVSLIFACNMLSDLELPFYAWPVFSRCLDEPSTLRDMCTWYLRSIHWNLHVHKSLYRSVRSLVSPFEDPELIPTPRLLGINTK